MMARKLFISVLSLTTVLIATSVHAHDGHNSPVPSQACDDKHLNDPCEYSNTAQDLYRGTCREVERQLLCVRNQPIQTGHINPINYAPSNSHGNYEDTQPE